MSSIFGTLGLPEAGADRLYVNTVGQSVVYDAVQRDMELHNADLAAAVDFFVDGVTTDIKTRYKLPGGGYLQPRGIAALPANVKATGQWDVAFPLADYGAMFTTNDIGLAYMSLAELNRHLDTIALQDKNTVRREIMKAMLDNTQQSFVDPINGTLLIEPLANGDSVLYPAVLGSDSEATENHMYGTNYVTANISDTNDPTITVRDELEEHFGAPTSGSNIVMLVTPAIGAKIETLTDFDAVTNRNIIPGANVDTVTGIPSGMPGRVLGVCNGVWIAEWRWLPADYSIAMHMDAPKPLRMRIDPTDTGLGSGLQLVAKNMEVPFENSFYRHRFGFGVANRLNGVALKFVASTSYATPTGYAR